MKIKFWGVRGSIPSPGKNTVKYGGNTSCVSVTAGHGNNLIILDGGSGLRELGIDLMKKQFGADGINPLSMWIFFSHVHWDHIQGVPFFKPLFIKGNTIRLYGEKKVRTCLEDTLKGQQQYPNFPISIEEISVNGAEMTFTDLFAGEKIRIHEKDLIGDVIVHNTKLSHPDGVFCYKIEELLEKEGDSANVNVVYATDTEHRNVLDPRLLKIAKGADTLIYDAQYTPDEYVGAVGMPKFDWGHSTYEFAVDTAVKAGIKHLFLFHHEPEHTDETITEIEKESWNYLEDKYGKDTGLIIAAAYEGMELEI